MALESLLRDRVTFERMRNCFEITTNLETDATEDAAEDVVYQFRDALRRAQERAAGRFKTLTETRPVLDNATVLVGMAHYFHPDLWAIVGEEVECRTTSIKTDDAEELACEISLRDGTRVCIARVASSYAAPDVEELPTLKGSLPIEDDTPAFTKGFPGSPVQNSGLAA